MELSSTTSHDVFEIIKENGFIDITPHIGNPTHKIFTKNGLMFRFLKWKKLDETQAVLCIEEIDKNIISDKILKIACPGCGNILNNYNFFDDGKNMFWCETCRYEILITKQ